MCCASAYQTNGHKRIPTKQTLDHEIAPTTRTEGLKPDIKGNMLGTAQQVEATKRLCVECTNSRNQLIPNLTTNRVLLQNDTTN